MLSELWQHCREGCFLRYHSFLISHSTPWGHHDILAWVTIDPALEICCFHLEGRSLRQGWAQNKGLQLYELSTPALWVYRKTCSVRMAMNCSGASWNLAHVLSARFDTVMRSPTPNPKLIVTAEVAAYVKKKMNGNAVNSQSCKQTNTKKEAVCSIPFRTSVGIEGKAGYTTCMIQPWQ